MSYRIEYGSQGAVRKPLKRRQAFSAAAAVACVLLLVFGALSVKHAGLGWVKDYLLPGDPAVTAAALEDLVEDIREGESLGDAVTAFCREIVENAD